MSFLIEQWVQPAQGDGFGRRITADGTAEEHTSVTASYAGGDLVFESQPAEWRVVGRAAPEALQMLDAAIRDAADLEVPDLPGTTVAKARITWTLGARKLELTDAHLQIAPALAALDQAFQLTFATAVENP
jgi:hypothetical protein